MPSRLNSCRFGLIRFPSGVAPQQPHYRREVRDEEDVGSRGGYAGGPGKRPAGDEPAAVRKALGRFPRRRGDGRRTEETK